MLDFDLSKMLRILYLTLTVTSVNRFKVNSEALYYAQGHMLALERAKGLIRCYLYSQTGLGPFVPKRSHLGRMSMPSWERLRSAWVWSTW